MLSFVYNAMQQGSMHKYKAYWYMSFSLINGCGTHENNIHGHYFFWSCACELTNIVRNCYQKSKQTSVRKICNFTINRERKSSYIGRRQISAKLSQLSAWISGYNKRFFVSLVCVLAS